ncbi:hypothetical protein P4637_13965 [Halalkalibacterium halodurans]|nr:hypothetical protein [Halalkalibacterium halodurans]MED4085912.1 hypothetical protein [Halalkalibacterium halodurans]MED4104006.1 hypothetical protein [Halalkalibacterium halodurans]MED4109843.1 hypothetical protein [Halalkalibacterium halodurans]MED4149391.1 hypothetical protein [Halalkalibacterium halodurans]
MNLSFDQMKETMTEVIYSLIQHEYGQVFEEEKPQHEQTQDGQD